MGNEFPLPHMLFRVRRGKGGALGEVKLRGMRTESMAKLGMEPKRPGFSKKGSVTDL